MSTRLQRMQARLQKLLADQDVILNKSIDDAGAPVELSDEDTATLEQLNKDVAHAGDIVRKELEDATRRKELAELIVSAPKPKAKVKAAPTADDDDDDEAPARPAIIRGVDDIPEARRWAAANGRDVAGIIKALGNSAASTSLMARSGDKPDCAIIMAVTACGLARAKALGGSVYDQMDALGFGTIAGQMYDAKIKALNTGTLGSGAEVMPETFSNDFIAFLRPASAILKAGPTRIDLSSGNLRISGGNAGAAASYRAEGSDVAYTEPTFREVTLTARNLAAITAVNNELLQRSPLAVAEILRTEMVAAFAQAMDYAGLRGDGTANAPMGIKSLVDPANVFVAPVPGVGVTIAQVDALAVTMIQRQRAANIPVLRPTWLMSSRTQLALARMRNSDGTKAFPSMDSENPRFWGYPVVVSNLIPDNLGVGTDESELYLQDMGHFWMGETEGMQVQLSEEASYVQSGTLISAFSRNQSVIRVVGAHDFQLRYNKTGVVATGLEWA